jgi:ribosomal protein S18 acetylase RimI-like enzyme
MIEYKRCTEAHEDDIFNAFQIGFSDYMIKFDLTKDAFMKHFFGPEGNRPEYSVIAFDDDKPIGLNLGGIKVYEGIKTIRCGALCVHPDYRGTEVAGKLFSLHKEIALENNCRQMFLEVIKGNDRAISFYVKRGYEKVYDLVYFSHKNPSEINAVLPEDLSLKRIEMDCLKGLSAKIQNTHINWQNDFDYIGHFDNQVHYGVYHNENLTGALSLQPSGRINFLWVDFSFRNKGIGSALISRAVNELNIKRLAISFPNNASLLGFLKRWNFVKDTISQYEMYITL